MFSFDQRTFQEKLDRCCANIYENQKLAEYGKDSLWNLSYGELILNFSKSL